MTAFLLFVRGSAGAKDEQILAETVVWKDAQVQSLPREGWPMSAGDRFHFHREKPLDPILLRTVSATYHCKQFTGREECEGGLFWKTCHKVYQSIDQTDSPRETRGVLYQQLRPAFMFRPARKGARSIQFELAKDDLNFIAPEAGVLTVQERMVFEPEWLDPVKQPRGPKPEEKKPFLGRAGAVCSAHGYEVDRDDVAIKAKPGTVGPVEIRVEQYRSH